MKRVILGAAATAVAATAAVLVPQAAGATGSGGGGTGDSVYIAPTADYNLSGASLDLDLVVKCSGSGTVAGAVNGSVSQSPPETASPITFSTGNTLVVCDGKSHTVGITVDGIGYDDGYATATMTLVNPNTLKTTTATAKIYITAH